MFVRDSKEYLRNKHVSPVCASLTTSPWGASRTLRPLMEMMMSPTSRPHVSAGVPVGPQVALGY